MVNKLSSAVLTEYRRMTDGQTDRQTTCDGRPIVRAIHTRRAIKMT